MGYINKINNILSTGFILFCASTLLIVSMMALIDPQSVMDLVQVSLKNTDAISSIRGAYGGLGLCLTIGIVYLSYRNQTWALTFLAMFWGFYALSRVLTICLDGPLGSFGLQWLYTELTLCFIALALLLFKKNLKSQTV